MPEVLFSIGYDNYEHTGEDVFAGKIKILLEDVESLLARAGAIDLNQRNNDAIQSCLLWMRAVPGKAFLTLQEFCAYTYHLSDRYLVESVLLPLYELVNTQFDPKASVVLQDILQLIDDLRERPWSRQIADMANQKPGS